MQLQYERANLLTAQSNTFSVKHFNFMEIQHNFKSSAGLLYFLYFLNSLYFKTCSLVQQYHKQSLMSQMEH